MLTVGYIDSREESLATAMRNQRPKTDKALEAWNQRVAEYSKSYAGTKFANNLDIAKKRLAELPKMRSEDRRKHHRQPEGDGDHGLRRSRAFSMSSMRSTR